MIDIIKVTISKIIMIINGNLFYQVQIFDYDYWTKEVEDAKNSFKEISNSVLNDKINVYREYLLLSSEVIINRMY